MECDFRAVNRLFGHRTHTKAGRNTFVNAHRSAHILFLAEAVLLKAQREKS